MNLIPEALISSYFRCITSLADLLFGYLGWESTSSWLIYKYPVPRGISTSGHGQLLSEQTPSPEGTSHSEYSTFFFGGIFLVLPFSLISPFLISSSAFFTSSRFIFLFLITALRVSVVSESLILSKAVTAERINRLYSGHGAKGGLSVSLLILSSPLCRIVDDVPLKWCSVAGPRNIKNR